VKDQVERRGGERSSGKAGEVKDQGERAGEVIDDSGREMEEEDELR
jgi:hypothetical protein